MQLHVVSVCYGGVLNAIVLFSTAELAEAKVRYLTSEANGYDENDDDILYEVFTLPDDLDRYPATADELARAEAEEQAAGSDPADTTGYALPDETAQG